MSIYTKQDILDLVAEEDVAFIRLQFTDIFGTLKNVAITPSQLSRALDGKFMFDGSAIEGFVRIEESDMFLVPDLDTFTIFPWRPQQGKVARMICDVYRTDNTPYEGDPRHVLKLAREEAARDGLELKVGPECEFFLFEMDENGHPTTTTDEQAGFFDTSPLDFGENARRDIVLTLEDMGFEVESSRHEAAPAQHEIDFRYGEALKAADNIQTFKLTVRTIARQHGLHATFMPKPKPHCDGSGMHLNMSLHRDGRNIFDDPASPDGLSDEARWFIGGLMTHIRGMSAVLNPLVNSYKRLVSGYEAPVYISWSNGNRSPLIRVPFASDGGNRRLELRSPDSAANPYLALALCLRAGLDGIRNQIEPPAPVGGNIYQLSPSRMRELGIGLLPGTLKEALDAMDADPFVRETLGDHLYSKYREAKHREWADFCAEITSWEIKEYLNKY